VKVAIYCRISTNKQELEQQIQSCIKYCEIKGWEYEVFTEQLSSTKERPIFASVLSKCINGDFNGVIVFRFDRAWRSSRQFIMDFDSLGNRGVYVISVMEGLDPTTPMGKAMMTILVALAELERTNISLATKQRLQALKNLGKTLGRPKGSKDKTKRKKTGYLLREAKKRGDTKLVQKYSSINE
jgi:DNA invertase Pin-like site-specific DNA recombinase